MANEYGQAPASDEVEIALFGPGIGEAIAVHMGHDHWMLIDSCMHPSSKLPATLHYLQQIGITEEKVKLIVASHWHDDHIQGLTVLAQAFPNAIFWQSGVFNDRESMAFLRAYSKKSASSQTGGTKELFNVMLSRKKTVQFAHKMTTLFRADVQGRVIQVYSFSPTAQAQAKAKARMATFIPTSLDETIGHAPAELSPNLEAVVLHVNLGDDAILLGSDLEDAGGLGWSEIVDDALCCGLGKASAFKVAHHGSITGHHDDIWNILLKPKPAVCLTPYNRSKLPTESDRIRIKGLASSSSISSGGTRRAEIPREQQKRMDTMCNNLVRDTSDFGAVRLRKKLGAKSWNVELFGAAQAL